MNNKMPGLFSSDEQRLWGIVNLPVSRWRLPVMAIHRYTTIFSIFFINLFCSYAMAEDKPLTLVNDNKSSYVIAVPSNAPGSVMDAANDLAYHFKKISGVEIPVINEQQIPKIDTVIYIGCCNAAASGIYPLSSLPPATYVLRSSGNKIYLYGDDTVLDDKYKVERTGTYSAVSMLLEKYLKCRWLMSGELGESIPSQSTVIIPPLNEVHTPVFPVHNIWLDRTNPDEVKWARRMRMGSSYIFDGGHAFENWYDSYGKTKPELFALQKNGTRIPMTPKGAHQCLSNLEIDKIWFSSAYQLLNRRAYQYSVSASFNDAGQEGFCLCKSCRNMDPQGAPAGTYYYGGTYHGEKFQMPAITDRYMIFVNRLADVLNYQWPGKFVAYTAYRNGITPPVAVKPLSNVIVFFAGFSYVDERCRNLSHKYFDGWRNLTEKIIIRPNILHHGAAMPLNYSRKLAEDVNYCADKNIYGFTYDGTPKNWGSGGINYYILARMLDNPQLQYKELFDEYCLRMYGEAASDMIHYYKELELFTNRIASSGNSNGIQTGWGWHMPEYYNDNEINKFCEILNGAKKCARDGKVIERIDLCLMSWEYARRLRDVCAAIRKNGNKDAAKGEMRRLDEWRSMIASSGNKAVDTKRDVWRWSCMRTAAEPSGFWEQIENDSLLPQEY